jgi:flagellar biosynthesis protein FlhF
MRLKSYFSATVEAAVEIARKALGDEALLVNARRSEPEMRHLGAYEVVFGTMKAVTAPGDASSVATSTDRPAGDGLARDVADMRRQIESLSLRLSGARMFAEGAESSVSNTYQRLIDNELDAAIAQKVAQGAPLEQFFEVDATLGRRGATRSVIALCGPPGAGKTTTLVKLAARFGLASRKPAQIITTDVYRIAAADQLRSLASILGIGCDVVETPVALAQALEEHRSKEIVFIDTPGLAKGEMEDGEDLARLMSTHPEIDTHLVLPASMKPADMAGVIERYSIFQPKKLLFTRLDETTCYGALINEAIRRSLPVSFLTTGQQIPDDLEPATKARLAEIVTGESKPARYTQESAQRTPALCADKAIRAAA